ncbi:MAG: TetR/AcrR family transcriptional regulator [Anaerostipes sp.]|nr:TetR/AcrR family transcriptional regulator [Anaerostipes sp.]
MSSRENNTKERILEEALKLFAQSGYMGTSMNDIADKLGVTKAALYKHYKSKQEILDSIVEKMNQMDMERVKKYEMPEGNMEEVVKGYQSMALDKIKQFTKVQFLHWTQEEFPCCFRKMLTLEQYRDPELTKLYQKYLSGGPLAYIEEIFGGFTDNDQEAKQLALDFYGPIFLLYSIYDGAEDKETIVEMVEQHVERFSEVLLSKMKEG